MRLRGISKAFGEGDSRTAVLRETDLEVRRGELFMLVGPSGCGKTTLLSILAGALRADAGEVHVLGRALHAMGEGARTAFRRTEVGFVFQQFNLIATLPAVENVAVPLLIQGVPGAAAGFGQPGSRGHRRRQSPPCARASSPAAARASSSRWRPRPAARAARRRPRRW